MIIKQYQKSYKNTLLLYFYKVTKKLTPEIEVSFFFAQYKIKLCSVRMLLYEMKRENKMAIRHLYS